MQLVDRQQRRSVSKRRQAGFTLVEILITAGIIGLLAAIVFPNYVKARENGEVAVTVANIRTASGAFFSYFAAEGSFPEAGAPGSVPAGMESYLERFPWSRMTAVGGQWAWDRDVDGYRAGVALSGVTASAAQMRLIDAKLDDGDLATGQFRARAGGGYIYIMDR